jgi:hypothetical protein
MKKIYSRIFLLLSMGIFMTINFQTVSGQFPVPDQALLFDEDYEAYNSFVKDTSGNNNSAFWWTYRKGTNPMYGGFKPGEGKFGGAWYMSGYHICCEEMASPSMDFILLAGSNNEKKDAEGFKGESPLYHKGFKSLTVAFWFKSDRNYAGNNTPCPPNPVEMHEQEILFSMGAGTALAIQNFKGYYEVRLGSQLPEQTAETFKTTYLYNGVGAVEKDWQHIAVTFDGDNNGALTVYLDGEVAQTYLGDPNPLETGLDSLNAKGASVELGAQTGGGLFGNVSDFWPGSEIGNYCLTAEDTTYRTGWPAAGYFDEYVFYKDKALSASEIQQIYTTGICTLIGKCEPDAVKPEILSTFKVYPNPAEGVLQVRSKDANKMDLAIYNILGKEMLRRSIMNEEVVDISSLPKGLYMVKINDKNTTKLVVK